MNDRSAPGREASDEGSDLHAAPSSPGREASHEGSDLHAALPTARQLRWRAVSLGVANAFDYGIQFLLPVVLVRFLDAGAFGEYRLLWLAVGTVMAVATMGTPGSLYYYLPRSDARTKRLYINQTILFLAATGLISGWAVSPWNPWLPESMRVLAADEAIVPAFVMLWVIASLLDPLPTIDERITWQVRTTIGLSALRAAALCAVAILTGDLGAVLVVLLAFTVFKCAVLVHYVARYHGLGGPLLRWRTFAAQLRYATPVGIAGALYGLRTQADQWVAAALFSLSMFASFSIAAVLMPLMNLFRLSVNYAFLPSMSKREAAGDIRGMLELNSHANVMVAVLVCPVFAYVFVFAEEVVTIVYTATYVPAADVMRVYIVGLTPLVVEFSTVTMLLGLAPFVSALNVVTLIIAVPLNWYFALRFGLPGAAVGSVAAIYVDRVVTLWRISKLTGVALRRLQDWRALVPPMLFSTLAATFAWKLVDAHFSHSEPMVRAFVGGVALMAAYGVMHGLVHIRRSTRAPMHL